MIYKTPKTINGVLYVYYHTKATNPDDWFVCKEFYNGYLAQETTKHKSKNRNFDTITVCYRKDVITAIETKTNACNSCHNGYNTKAPSFVEFQNGEIIAQNYSVGCNSLKYEKFEGK